MEVKAGKIYRILSIFIRLQDGTCIRIQEEADRFQVNRKTIQRDIADIRAFLADQMVERKNYGQVIYDHAKGGYRMIKDISIIGNL